MLPIGRTTHIPTEVANKLNISITDVTHYQFTKCGAKRFRF
jgi:hypothetical protein